MSYARQLSMTYEEQDLRTAIVERLRRTNWVAALAALVLQGLFLMLLSTIGVLSVGRSLEVPTLKLFPTMEQPAAPPPPAAPEEAVKPVPREQIKTEALVPPPTVPIPIAQTVQAAQEAPTPPAPPAAAPSAPATAVAASGSGPVRVSDLGTNLLSGAPPAYPMGSRRKREQGIVVLRLVISEAGRVMEVAIDKSSGFAALDEAAITAVRKWRWSPTMRDGKPIMISGLVRIPFMLKDS